MILAIDTATRWTGLALHDGDAVIAEHGWVAANTQTIELAPAGAQLLTRAQIGAADLKAIAVALGPGSYTGLRIGLGFAKGLALNYRTPLVGVPTLDVLAAGQPRFDGQLVAVAEAGRTRICAARYRWDEKAGWQAAETPIIVAWDELLAQVDGPATFVGEIAPDAARQIRAADKAFRLVPAAANVRRAAYLAEIGWKRLRRGKLDTPRELVPIYLKEP